jgi:glycosyltransferase involved in cell wall biosynthesis
VKDLRARKELKKIIREYKPDVIHSHTFKAGVLARSIRSSSKYVHTYHGHILSDGSLSYLQIQMVLAAERHYAKKTEYLISVGEKVADELRELGIGRHKTWSSIAPGINPLILPNRVSTGELLGIDPNKKTVGWLGRMVGVKDPHMMVEIAKLIPDVQILMAGGGELLESIREIAPPNVIVSGWVPREEVLACSDLLVMTSTSEGMPLAAIEAQFAGIPVIAPKVGSLPEVVSDGDSGLIIKRDVVNFAKVITELITDKSRCEQLSSGARLRSESRFTVEFMVKEHIKIYKDVTESVK